MLATVVKFSKYLQGYTRFIATKFTTATNIRGGMHNTVVTATSKLKSIYDGVVFTSVCMTPMLVGGLLPNYR